MNTLTRFLAIYAIGFLLLIVTIPANPPSDNRDIPIYVPPKTSVVDKQFNFHIVAPGLWRSAQPNEESIVRMKKYGLKTIVNLRKETTDSWEKNMAHRLGLNYFYFPMDGTVTPEKSQVEEVLKTISDPSLKPVLIHCLGGKDRTGTIIAIYKMQHGASIDEAYQEMLMLGYDEEQLPKLFKFVKEWAK